MATTTLSPAPRKFAGRRRGAVGKGLTGASPQVTPDPDLRALRSEINRISERLSLLEYAEVCRQREAADPEGEGDLPFASFLEAQRSAARRP